MAYVPTYVDDEDETQNQAQAITTAAASPTAGATETATATTPLSQKGYVGIGQYLQANKEQAQNLAKRVMEPISTGVQSAQQAQKDYDRDYKAQASMQGEAWKASKAKEQSTAIGSWQKQLEDAYYNWQRAPAEVPPGMVSARDTYEKAYKDLLANQPKVDTSGAPSAPAYTPDTSAAQAAESELTSLGTQEGRQAILQGIGGPGYTAGENMFDAALLGGTDVGAAGSQYEGILNALRSPTAPTVNPATYTPTTIDPARMDSAAKGAYWTRLANEKQAAKFK